MIENYKFGEMTVDGVKYSSDLILLPGRIIPSWWRQDGHKLSCEDLQSVFDEEISALVIGTGFHGQMKVQQDVRRAAEEKGIRMHVEKTARAVQIFNQLSEHEKTAGAFHLTC
jgi:hypothetical protein